MASRGSIISSVKAIPGGSRPSPANQGLAQTPYVGNFSPLSGQLDNGNQQGAWTNAYRGTLPRPPQDFTNGAFGPFSPILPVPVDAPPDGSDFAEARRYEYQVGWNLPTGTPGSEGIKLVDFATLRSLADLYSVARACIQLRKSEIISLEWDVMPTRDASKAMRSDHAAMKDFGERRAEAIKFFRKPDPNYFTWNSFLDALLEEVLVFDAMSLIFRRKWGKNRGRGLLGSDLDSLNLINGPTIRPLRDLHGATPRPPAPAYQQYLYGVPRTDLMTIMMDRDIEEGGLTGAEYNKYRTDQLLYMPLVPRTWTPYGLPPIERALVPVMSGLQRQGYQLDYFREGSVPAVYISPGGANNNMTPNQIRELQDALNAVASDPAWHHKIIVLPADSKVMPQRSHPLADQFDEVVMNQVCMAYDVSPMELGIAPKVSPAESSGTAKMMAKAAQDIQTRKATKPLLKYLTDIMNYVLQDVCKQDDMRFVFEGLEDTEDEETLTKTMVTQVSAGMRSIDEARERFNLQPWGLAETAEPGWATPGAGFIPLTEATMARQTGYSEGPLLEDDPNSQPNMGASDGDIPAAKPSPGVTATGASGAPAAPAKPPAPRKAAPAAPTGATVSNGSKTPPKAGDQTRKKPGASQALGGGSGVSAPGRKPSTKSVQTYDASRTRAVLSELEALVRHVRKGRELESWEARHLDLDALGILTLLTMTGAEVAEAADVLKRRRMVDIDGQELWTEDPVRQEIVPAGGGGPYQHPHDVNDIWMNKGASDYDDPNPVESEHIMNQLRQNYPEKSISWVQDARWIGPVQIPLDRIDFDDVDSWSATHEPDRVKHFAKEIKKDRSHLHPVIAVQEPGDSRVKVIDGHHRTLAYRSLDKSVTAYVGFVSEDGGPWDETHSSQVHHGEDKQDKSSSEKLSKDAVNYREAENPRHSCGTCSMFVAPNGCTLVSGLIDKDDTCDRWDAADA